MPSYTRMGTRAAVHAHGCANVCTAMGSPCVVCHPCGREAPFTHRLCRGQSGPPGPHVGPLGVVIWLHQNHDPHFAGGETETWKGLLIGLRSPNWPILGSGLELEVRHSEPLSGTTCGLEPRSFENVGAPPLSEPLCAPPGASGSPWGRTGWSPRPCPAPSFPAPL